MRCRHSFTPSKSAVALTLCLTFYLTTLTALTVCRTAHCQENSKEEKLSYDILMQNAARLQKVKNQYRICTQLANIALKQGYPERALDSLRELLNVDIHDLPKRRQFEQHRRYVYIQMLEIMADHGMVDRIASLLKEIRQAYPDDPDMQVQIHMYEALIMSEQGRLDEAVRQLHQAEELNQHPIDTPTEGKTP